MLVDEIKTLLGNVLTDSEIAELDSMSDRSHATNGYQVLPGNLIVQWGYETGGFHSKTITFPIAFPNALFSVVAAVRNTSAATSVRINSQSVTSFNVSNWQGGGASNGNVFWIAFGN